MQDPRRYKHTFRLPLTDLGKLKRLSSEIESFLEASPATDSSQSCSTGLTDFSGDEVELTVEVWLLR